MIYVESCGRVRCIWVSSATTGSMAPVWTSWQKHVKTEALSPYGWVSTHTFRQNGERLIRAGIRCRSPVIHMADPFVSLMAAAAATTLKIGTGVCLVIEHDLIVLAKTVSTLDVW
jgi:hypothetical protein